MSENGQIQLSIETVPWERGTDGKPELLSRGETIAFDEIEEAYKSWGKIVDASIDVPVDRSWLPNIDELITAFNVNLHLAMTESLWYPFLTGAVSVSLYRATLESLLRTFLTPIQRISKSSEIEEIIQRDKHLRTMLDISVTQIIHLLQQEENYLIHVFYEQDIEVPKWKEVVISVRITERSYDDKMRLWELIEGKVRTKIEEIRTQLPKKERRRIDRLNEKLSIRVKESIF